MLIFVLSHARRHKRTSRGNCNPGSRFDAFSLGHPYRCFSATLHCFFAHTCTRAPFRCILRIFFLPFPKVVREFRLIASWCTCFLEQLLLGAVLVWPWPGPCSVLPRLVLHACEDGRDGHLCPVPCHPRALLYAKSPRVVRTSILSSMHVEAGGRHLFIGTPRICPTQTSRFVPDSPPFHTVV